MSLITSRCGDHVLTFDEVAHEYKLNGIVVGGATDVKKAYPPSIPIIKYWIKQGLEEFESGKKLKDQAAVGTVMHDYCFALRTGKTYDNPAIVGHKDEETIRRRMAEVEAWVKEREQFEEVVAAEEIIASPRYWMAGKFDCLVRRKDTGRLRLQDYKSAKGFYVDQFIQGGVYDQCLREWKGLKIDEIEIIRFNDNTEKPAAHVIDDIDDFRQQAISCRQSRYFMHKWDRYFDKLYRANNPRKYVKRAKKTDD